MSVLFYAIAKYVFYSAWCYVGLRLLRPTAANVPSALRFGIARWLLGLGFGFGVFIFAGSIDVADVAVKYFAIYTPLRVVEWGIIAIFMTSNSKRVTAAIATQRILPWVIGGIAVSFLTDFLSPEGLSGHFCVGRCLC